MWYGAVGFVVALTLSLLAAPLATTTQSRGHIPRALTGSWASACTVWHKTLCAWRATGSVLASPATSRPVRGRPPVEPKGVKQRQVHEDHVQQPHRHTIGLVRDIA